MVQLPIPRWDTTLPPYQRKATVLKQLDAWIRSDTLFDLARAWDGAVPRNALTAELFAWYDNFSADHWDYRAGRERNLATAPPLSDEQVATAYTAASDIGLAAFRPAEGMRYDYTLILGGMIRACLTRPRYAEELAHSGVHTGDIVALGGFRPLRGDEIELAAALGISAQDEFEGMLAGIKRAFPDLEEPAVETSVPFDRGAADWAVARFPGSDVSVIAAPSREPNTRRANTADTFAWWAESHTALRGSSVLLVTNSIYVPYQGAAAIENLGIPYDVSVETVGISPRAADLGEATQSFGPHQYLQETRSSIRGYRSLHRRLAPPAAPLG